MDIENIVTDILEDYLGTSVENELDANIFDRFGADQVDYLDIVMEIEKQLGIEIPDDDFQTAQELIDITLELIDA